MTMIVTDVHSDVVLSFDSTKLEIMPRTLCMTADMQGS